MDNNELLQVIKEIVREELQNFKEELKAERKELRRIKSTSLDYLDENLKKGVIKKLESYGAAVET